MRAFSTLELLVCIAIISLLISMTFFFRWDDTKKELEDSQEIQNATTELWLVRIEDPSQPVYWVLGRQRRRVVDALSQGQQGEEGGTMKGEVHDFAGPYQIHTHPDRDIVFFKNEGMNGLVERMITTVLDCLRLFRIRLLNMKRH